jgi:hypothetical protein
MIPYNNDTRESYIERMKANYLDLAERYHNLGYSLNVWLHLFTWVQCEEIYGDHWDKVKEKNA